MSTKISSVKPETVTVGVKSTLTAHGVSSVDVSSGVLHAVVKQANSDPLAYCDTRLGKGTTCTLGPDVGHITLDPPSNFTSGGQISIGVSFDLNKDIPSHAQSTRTRLTVVSTSGRTSGQEVLCVDIVLQPWPTVAIPTKEIVPGVHMPMSGIGTWLYNDTVAEAAVSAALKYGVRSIDTAYNYGNQVGVGNAIRASGVERQKLFITTKVPGALGEDGTVAAHETNLKQLGLSYVDLLLVHFPCSFQQTGCNPQERQATWRGLERMQKAGKARAIGVSHYCQQHLEDVLQIATVPIAINQQEWHVGMGPDPQGVRSYCEQKNITFQSFSPLCGPCGPGLDMELITGQLVTDIGFNHWRTGAQVSLKWLVENGSPVISKTNNPVHLAQNTDLFNWEFTEAEWMALNAATSPPSVETVAGDCKISITV